MVQLVLESIVHYQLTKNARVIQPIGAAPCDLVNWIHFHLKLAIFVACKSDLNRLFC